jgi:integrase
LSFAVAKSESPMKIEKFYNKKEKKDQYRARFQIGGKAFRVVADTRGKLAELCDEIRVRERRGGHDLPVRLVTPRLKDLFDKYLAARRPVLQSYGMTERACRMLEEVAGEECRLSDLRSAHFQAYIEKRTQEKIAPATINRELSAISPALKRPELFYPELEGWRAPRIPKAKVRQKRRERLIGAGEAGRLLDHLRERQDDPKGEWFSRLIADIFEFALLTGLRRKEICMLKYSDYDPERNSLRVVRYKTGTVTDFCPLPKRAVEIILERKETKEGEFVFSKDGTASRNMYYVLRKACKALKLDFGRTDTGFTLHDTRHVFITNLIRKGVDIETVKTFSGHTDSKSLLRYTHSSPRERRRAIDLIDGTERLEDLAAIYEAVRNGEMELAEFLRKIEQISG